MPGTILVGYDIETGGDSTRGFLAGATRLHRELGVPMTLFVTGQTLEGVPDAFDAAAAVDDIELGQHTYSHMLLKSVWIVPRSGIKAHGKDRFFLAGGTVEQIRGEIMRTQAILRDRYGVACRGLTGPWGYYRGLSDRPEILAILHAAGIRYVRTWARDERHGQPTPIGLQPFFYADAGFPDILECFIHGYQDDYSFETFARRPKEAYAEHLCTVIDKVVESDLVFSLCAHDHETPTIEAFNGTKGRWLRPVLAHAVDRGARLLTYGQYYDEMRREHPGRGTPYPK